jgi:hypothetical protein
MVTEHLEQEFGEKLSVRHWYLDVDTDRRPLSVWELQAAIKTHYERLAASARTAVRQHLLMAQMLLLGGIAIFIVINLAHRLLEHKYTDLPPILDEGLIILGWLAIWRPTEMLLFEWVPLFRKYRMFKRLAGIRVREASLICPPGGSSFIGR